MYVWGQKGIKFDKKKKTPKHQYKTEIRALSVLLGFFPIETYFRRGFEISFISDIKCW